jgi:hypothetical protein
MIKYMRTAAIAAVLLGCLACGDVVRDNRAATLVTVTSLTPSFLNSDVVRLVTAPAPCSAATPCPTITNDTITATITTAMKNTSVSPTTNNQVTLNRYHVEFRRADGRNVEGIDVPRSFDGAVTVSIAANGSAGFSLELVRHVAKQESPLTQLVNSPNAIATIATITFYGTDAVGNVVSASGQMSVNFGNFADQ